METIIEKTDGHLNDGQNKCPKCGSTDISLNIKNGKLRCNFCRFEFENNIIDDTDLSKLEGKIVSSGATDIKNDSNDMVTLKCTSCGSEVVIDTKEALQARCHWCRNTLSINNQIPNGAVPDMVLPFNVIKDDAKIEIEKFVNKRKFYANNKFKEEFTTDNIMGVYFPYMVIDMNVHTKLVGQGEHLLRRYTVGSGDNRRTYYDAELYDVSREFDLTIDNLTVESNSKRLDHINENQTNNVINAIMPFDIEKCVKWDANYLKGYTSERRDTNVDTLSDLVVTQAKDIARFKANDTLSYYDRGVRWDNEDLNIKGQKWSSAYLPVWLYSYQQVKDNKSILHYVAVNARTKETMGSIPINVPKLLIISLVIETIAIILALFIDFDGYQWLLAFGGPGYYYLIYSKYRNKSARHTYELETTTKMDNLVKTDNYVKKKTKLSNSTMDHANNYNINGSKVQKSLLDNINKDVS